MFPFYKSYSTSSRSDKTMRCGFSLPELVTYSGLAGIVGLFMWSMMNNFTKKQNNLEELNKILIEKNVTVQQISRLLAKSEANPRAYDGSNTVTFTIGDLNFTNQDGKCMGFNDVVNEQFIRQSLWLGFDDANGPHAVYHGVGIGCEDDMPDSVRKISEPIYVKKDTSRAWFISDNQTVQFNLKPQGKLIGQSNNTLDLDINASQTVIKYNKIQDIGCRIASPNQSWFNGLPADYRYAFVAFTSNYNDDQDRLTLTGVNCAGNNSTTIGGVSVNCLFCHAGSTSAKCPQTQHNIDADHRARGFLHLDAGAARTSTQWQAILNELEYVPRCVEADGCTAPIVINPGSEISSKRLITILLSNNQSILEHDQNLGTGQGSFLLNLHRLSQSCTHENF
ncbi:hypothetical protein N9O82_01975 [Methylophilaceae bacterium]|jgi:hypothetical protein|nr:hypothetical protein [Methylophilaceae bacterium]